jgi:hypothetical protein
MTTGTVMIFVSPEGRVIAHAACFEPGAPVGYTEAEFQELRCLKRLNEAVFDAFCSPVLVKATDEFQRERVVNLMERDGYRRHTITVEVPA